MAKPKKKITARRRPTPAELEQRKRDALREERFSFAEVDEGLGPMQGLSGITLLIKTVSLLMPGVTSIPKQLLDEVNGFINSREPFVLKAFTRKGGMQIVVSDNPDERPDTW